ncbi:MAG TPA: hypothetical protein VG893_04080 [Terracidiphilus sp.]|nr:hypothetical protein [Terracidiphilus sp.]
MQLAIPIRPIPTDAEIKEAIALLRPPDLAIRLIVGNWYICAILLAVLALDAYRILRGRAALVSLTLSVVILLCAVFLFSYFRWAARIARDLRAFGQHVRELSVEYDGLRMVGGADVVTVMPWSAYRSWHEGKSIFLLQGRDGAVILPAETANRDVVRGLLQSMIH